MLRDQTALFWSPHKDGEVIRFGKHTRNFAHLHTTSTSGNNATSTTRRC